ncbi:MAG: YkgJ family cysteine cluster protein [Candidatus Lokiarchaeota archaeon]|nr:YkgJ family cysteine cluster protein [Candidatus Lokiarchaeota archaeon]
MDKASKSEKPSTPGKTLDVKGDDHSVLEKIDPEAHVSSPPLTDNPFYCVQHCSGFCCSEYTVLITAIDAKRILDSIPGIHVYQFLTFYDESVETLNFYPIIKIKGNGHVIGMIQDAKHKTCPFHTALGLCGIHDFSPMVCQTYPFSLTEDHEVTYLSRVKCGKLFPPFNEERIKKIVLQSWKEIDEYKDMVKKWNEKHGTDGDFDDFLVFTGLLKERPKNEEDEDGNEDEEE